MLIKTLIPHPTSERARTNNKLSNHFLFLRLESALFGYLMNTEDFEEGVAAFVEKRKANFKGK